MAAVDAAVRPAQARTRSACILHDNVARSLQAVQDIVRQLDLVSEAESAISGGPSMGISAYLDAVDKLKGAKDFFTSNRRCKAGDDVLRRVGELLPKSVVELENEFRKLLSKCRDIRSSTLELTLKQLGVEYVTAEEVEAVEAENLNAKVDQWIQCLQISVKLLFASERVLCDQIFKGNHGLKDHCFAAVLECLSAQGLTSSVGSGTEGILGSIGNTGSYSGTTSSSVIKARSFNKQFEEVCETQINWAIPDRELRDNLILAVAEILSPAYRSFVKCFGPLVENSKNASKYIKYSPEALEQALGNLFAKKLVQ
ncbi:hypothetical protein ACQ4PT_037111 [Festuca glaucescens]